MDGPLNQVVGDWTGLSYRDPIYVQSLDPEIRADEEFGQPHEEYKCIRVAGTNGKGSTTRMIAWSLQQEGYDVGVMSNVSTTKELTDTIKCNGKKISESMLKEICLEVSSVADNRIEPYGVRTIAALEWFSRKDIDVAVLESGVGSRYDATNIVESDVYVVTNIGEDHIESMGGERKSMIEDFSMAEQGVTVTNAEEETVQEMREVSKSEIMEASSKAVLEGPKEDLTYDCVIKGDSFNTAIKSSYQEQNLNTALEALKQCSFEVSTESVMEVLSDFRFEGRAEMVDGSPRILMDGAHNIDGIDVLTDTLESFEGDITVVFTALDDKPWKSMLDKLSLVSSRVILTKPQGGKRDNNQDELKSLRQEYISDPLDAINKAEDETDESGLVVVTGSLYMIKEVREEIV